ncbi:hypothetical protein CAPTEDRAFT_216937, partial [Capitella teleta]
MKIFAFLILVLFADFAMGEDIHMSFATKLYSGSYEVSTEFADADDFYFGVKACSGAAVDMSEVVVSTGEVVLDCNEMQYYWMNKANGLLTVGRGLQSGTDIILTHELPEGLSWNEVYFVNLGDSVTEFEKQVKAP